MTTSTPTTAADLLASLDDLAATLAILADDYEADRPVDPSVMEGPYQAAVVLFGRWTKSVGLPPGSPTPNQILASYPGPMVPLETVARWLIWATFPREVDDLRQAAYGEPVEPTPNPYPNRVVIHRDTWRVADGQEATGDWFTEPIAALLYYEGAAALDAAWIRDRIENRRSDWLAELPGLMLGMLYAEGRGGDVEVGRA